jgi:hypothetical protein
LTDLSSDLVQDIPPPDVPRFHEERTMRPSVVLDKSVVLLPHGTPGCFKRGNAVAGQVVTSIGRNEVDSH